MDRLKDEYYDENEDFSEIDALLDAWSCREVDTPEDLHQRIMGALPLENKKRNGKIKGFRVIFTIMSNSISRYIKYCIFKFYLYPLTKIFILF